MAVEPTPAQDMFPADGSGLREIPNLEFRTEILAWKVSFDLSRREACKAPAIKLHRPFLLFFLGVD
jgi:hypothetical protein